MEEFNTLFSCAGERCCSEPVFCPRYWRKKGVDKTGRRVRKSRRIITGGFSPRYAEDFIAGS
jgi:hypothetical protein